MKLGILGSGGVGRSLASGFLHAGHQVRLATRNPTGEELLGWCQEHGGPGILGTFAEAAHFGETLFLCTNWSGTRSALDLCGEGAFRGKLLVDVTNPLDGKGPDASGRMELVPGKPGSGGEQIQLWLPEALVVKALNSIGYSLMDHPDFSDGVPTMMICGDNERAKHSATHLIHQLGWSDVVDLGDILMSRHLESLCILWCAYGFRTGTWKHAFSLLKK